MGGKKRQQTETCFHPGRKAHNKGKKFTWTVTTNQQPGHKRLPINLHAEVATAKEPSGPPNVHLLRPGPAEEDKIDSYTKRPSAKTQITGCRIVDMQKTADLWNRAVKEHRELHSECYGYLQYNGLKEVQRGLASTEVLYCTSCDYESEPGKLYDEAETETLTPGPKPAAINLRLQVGLSHTPISCAAFRKIMMAINVPPPSRSSMQRRSNQVSERLVTLNKEDMAKQRKKLHDINELRGEPREAPVPVEGDARYNNRLPSSVGKKPTQAGTQATYTLTEQHSGKGKIVALTTVNMLCPTGQKKRNKGLDVQCPDHEGCTMNIPTGQAIGDEASMAKDCFDQVIGDVEPLKVNYFTTDGDSRAQIGCERAHLEHEIEDDILENLRDLRHMIECQRMGLKKVNFSSNFVGQQNKAQYLRHFSTDFSKRCYSEISKCAEKYAGNLDMMINKLSFTMDAIISCYMGDCTLCDKYSFVCKKKSRWCQPYITVKRLKINPTDSDTESLRHWLKYCMGRQALTRTHGVASTQKSEAHHRAYNMTNPKDNTMARNFHGRIHSAVHLLNHGIANSTVQKLEAVNAPLDPGSKCAFRLQSEQKANIKSREYKKSDTAKLNRYGTRMEKYRTYNSASDSNVYTKHESELKYTKPQQKQKPARLGDHSYSKSSPVRALRPRHSKNK